MANFRINKLVIFGVGLIGGSFALALREADAVKHVVGVGRGRDNLERAVQLKVIDEIASDIKRAVSGADCVLLATPVGQMAELMRTIAPHLDARAVITDAGSTKQDVVQLARESFGDCLPRFVPAHPIAGAETSGVGAARADLYRGKNVVITPLAETDALAVDTVCAAWRACGAKLGVMKADEHDRVFAAVSHLPHVLAYALVNMLAQRWNADQLFDFAASGFRDFTRIAGSSPEMWRDICVANREALVRELRHYQGEIERVTAMIEGGQADRLQAVFAGAREARSLWLAGQGGQNGSAESSS
ncbi:MAG: prephenate dehydrogenase/arogenate dehydrogenase family protein [Burkholderiales bacterium]|nr:prephenate dehydrogenase/arogenate dehydrogenase family protein [Burkholderiales bacterium]